MARGRYERPPRRLSDLKFQDYLTLLKFAASAGQAPLVRHCLSNMNIQALSLYEIESSTIEDLVKLNDIPILNTLFFRDPLLPPNAPLLPPRNKRRIHNFVKQALVISTAIEAGLDNILYWALENGFPLSPTAAAMACRQGKFDLLKMLIDRECRIDGSAFTTAYIACRHDILDYLETLANTEPQFKHIRQHQLGWT